MVRLQNLKWLRQRRHLELFASDRNPECLAALPRPGVQVDQIGPNIVIGPDPQGYVVPSQHTEAFDIGSQFADQIMKFVE